MGNITGKLNACAVYCQNRNSVQLYSEHLRCIQFSPDMVCFPYWGFTDTISRQINKNNSCKIDIVLHLELQRVQPVFIKLTCKNHYHIQEKKKKQQLLFMLRFLNFVLRGLKHQCFINKKQQEGKRGNLFSRHIKRSIDG